MWSAFLAVYSRRQRQRQRQRRCQAQQVSRLHIGNGNGNGNGIWEYVCGAVSVAVAGDVQASWCTSSFTGRASFCYASIRLKLNLGNAREQNRIERELGEREPERVSLALPPSGRERIGNASVSLAARSLFMARSTLWLSDESLKRALTHHISYAI